MENLILKNQVGRLGHTFISLNPCTTIVIGPALVNYVTSGSKSCMACDPGATCFKLIVKASLFAQR